MAGVLASVVLTTYNGELYIKEQLDSLFKQTYKNVEIIIVDDCSTDNTCSIIREYIEKNKLNTSWCLFVNESNKGWRKNFIDGMLLARGDYIFPCDQDDIWNDKKIERCIAVMEDNPSINVLASNIREFNSEGLENVRPRKEDGKVLKHKLVQNFFNNEYPGCAMCVRNGYFKSIVSYWYDDVPHDALLWRWSIFDGTLYTLGETLINQRIHNTSTYTVEAKNNKTYAKKIVEINYLDRQIVSIRKYIVNASLSNENSEEILSKSESWIKERRDLYNKWSVIKALKLIKYLDCYSRKRQYLLDLYLAAKR